MQIVTLVLEGTLRHERGSTVQLLGPGRLLRQDATETMRHTETNPSATVVLRFVQTTWLADSKASVSLVPDQAEIDARLVHLYVARGSFTVDDLSLAEGDSLRSDQPLSVAGSGELLLWRSE